MSFSHDIHAGDTMPAIAIADEDAFVSGASAQKLLGIRYAALQRLAALGVIRIRAERGNPTKFSHADCLKILAERGVAAESAR